jgi:hypothetical protein
MTDTIPCTDFDLDKVVLLGGGHGDVYHGECCFVEAANVAAACIPELREKYGAAPFMADHPSISPVIRGFSISWNDGMNEEDRNRILKPRITQILGTKTTQADEETRAWMALDWLARVHTPAWLRLAGLTKEAQALEGTARIVDAVTCESALPSLRDAQRASAAAWDAASAAAWDAASAAAWDAAWDAATLRVPLRVPLRVRCCVGAASAAAWDAASAAASAAAWAAARDAARAAAWDAAWDAARAAARDAARAPLAPTVLALQESAAQLLDDMCAVGRKKAA